MNIEEKLEQLGLALPSVAKPIASYVPAVRCGSLLYISGQFPWRDGALMVVGKVPSEVPVELARQAAAQCVLHALAAAQAELLGDLSRIVRAIRLGVFVQSDNDFTNQSKVANGASDLVQSILGDAGKHVRAAVGVNALPLNASVEVEFLFELR